MFKYFITDSQYLLKYALKNITLLVLSCLILFSWASTIDSFNLLWLWLTGLVLFVLPYFWLIFLSGLFYISLYIYTNSQSVSAIHFLWIPVGVLLGTMSAAIMHNAAHDNLRPKWANNLIGELCGLFQVTGFAGWRIAHMIHHSHPDIPGKDPHPPMNLTYSQYANSMGVMMKDALTKKYFNVMGVSSKTSLIWTAVLMLSPLIRFLRVLVVLLLLGPTLFVFLYVPFKIANALIYIDFNYRTHRPLADGGFEIVNLNHHWWFKFLNEISFGSYFHLNHHRHPLIFNPKHLKMKITLPPKLLMKEQAIGLESNSNGN